MNDNVKKVGTPKKTNQRLRVLPVFEFIKRLRRLAEHSDNRIVFFLGAGCSVSSGIPGAATLALKWIKELKELQMGEKISFEDWLIDSKKYKDFLKNNSAVFYSKVIRDRFPSDDERQIEIEKIVSRKDPGFGYAVLAKLLDSIECGQCFSKVLTTNFDDLIADALYVYSNKKPLVITHEALISYARLSSQKLTIIKLHGDAHLSPMNTEKELKEIEPGIKKALKGILSEAFLVFIGYGGNDLGILNLLQEIPELRDKVYWVNTDIPTNSFRKWLSEINALHVNHLDFDQLMLPLFLEFKLEHPKKERFDQLIKKYHNTFNELNKKIMMKTKGRQKDKFIEVFDDVAKEFKDWFSVKIEAQKYFNTQPKKSIQIFQEGLKKFPNSALLFSDYADFLSDVVKDHDKAEKFYIKAINLEPEDSLRLRDYASFLEEVRKNYKKAEEFYKKAIDADPQNSFALYSYAIFLDEMREDHDKAEKFHKKATDVDPKDAFALNNYAVFLQKKRKDYDKAEKFFREALKVDPGNAFTLNDFANFLLNIREDYDEAEKFFWKTIDVDSTKFFFLRDYANFLEKIRKDKKSAQKYHKLADKLMTDQDS